MWRLKQILKELECKWFGHRLVKYTCRGLGLDQKLVRRHSILNRKGGKSVINYSIRVRVTTHTMFVVDVV